MDHRPKADEEGAIDAAALAAALDWWRDAGLDNDFAAQPARWLPPDTAPSAGGASPPPRSAGAAAAQPQPGEPAAAPVPAIDRSGWPQDLASFAGWWLAEPALDDGRTSGRVPPRGPLGAELMVIVPDPERDDAAGPEARLLSGPQGRLLEAMLAAMGVAPDAVYLASVLPRHMPMPDWASLDEKGFGALLRHHVALVRPKRMVALGGSILPLLGHDPAHNPAVLRHFNHEGLTIPLLAGISLAALLERPRWKAGLWRGWLDWTR
jgi:DNA polymerase